MKPAELASAELVVGLLERFPGYTLDTIRAEGAELLHLCRIVELGRPDPKEPPTPVPPAAGAWDRVPAEWN